LLYKRHGYIHPRKKRRRKEMNSKSNDANNNNNSQKLLFETNRAKTSIWSQRFIVSAILQGSLIIVLTSLGIAIQLMYSSTTINIIQFLSLSFEGPAKWIFLGYMFYLTLITMIAITAIFYNHLEVNLQKRIRGIKSVLAWINLIGINVGGAAAALTIIYAGLVGSGILDLMMTSGSTDTTNLKQNTAIMADFVLPIAAFSSLLITGALAGTIVYFATYSQNSLQFDKRSISHSVQGGNMY
jgi:energy-converting hydrogenase Eha subunit E